MSSSSSNKEVHVTLMLFSHYHSNRIPEVEMNPQEKQPEIKDFLFINNLTVLELSDDLIEVNLTDKAQTLLDIAEDIAVFLEEDIIQEIDTYPSFKLRTMLQAKGNDLSISVDDLTSQFQYRKGGWYIITLDVPITCYNPYRTNTLGRHTFWRGL